tara:strand:- start:1957 stop:2271 length:315 start_codon:yes stop_codon:yes gene_type:complete
MIPFIRSMTELMALTAARDDYNEPYKIKDNLIPLDRNKKEEFDNEEASRVCLPDIPKFKKTSWVKSKRAIYSFFDDLDYNNQIQPSLDLTLLGRQDHNKYNDAA